MKFAWKRIWGFALGKTRLNFSDLETLRSLEYLEAVDAHSNTSGVATYTNISLSARAEGVGVNNFAIEGLRIDAEEF